MLEMQNEIYQQEPNLIAEAYRNCGNCQIPRRIEKHFDFLDISDSGLFLLGTSNLSGRIWSGSAWVFEDFPGFPDTENCLAGIEFESSIASGLWLNSCKNIIIGCDSGALHHLSLTKIENKKKGYFTTEGIATEHDDSIVSLDLLKKRMKILSGGMDMNIRVWDAETLVSEKSYCPAHGHMVTSVSTLIDNSDIFMSTSLDGTSLIWDIRLEKPASLLIKNESGFTASAWFDENCVSVGSNDGSISLVDLRMKSEFDRNFASKRPIFKVKYCEELDLLAVCADDPFVRVFSCRERNLTNVLVCSLSLREKPCQGLKEVDDEEALSGLLASKVLNKPTFGFYSLKLRTSDLYESDQHKDFVRGLAWEPSSKTLYSCGWDSKIFSHQASSFEIVKINDETVSDSVNRF